MVDGLARFNQRWAAIPDQVRRAVIEEMENQAIDIVEEMWSRAPYGETGRLASSIGWTWGKAPKGTITVGSVGGREYGSLRITIYAGGDDAFYAWFVEFGTAAHSLTKNASVSRAQNGSRLNQRRQATGPQHPGTPAQPFFFPVWRARKKKVKAGMARALRKGIRSA